jgi:hypothetical protein
MDKISRFFSVCSGVHRPTLEQFPLEESKYVGIGATVFFTGLFAALSSSYALFFVFENYYVSALFGITWGLFIFSLDRFIVGSMRKSGTLRKDLGLTVPRIFLAVLISIVIATPLELKIFEKEISNELQLMETEKIKELELAINSRFSGESELTTTEIARLDATIDLKTEQRNSLQEAARMEADGTGGSKIRNAGPIYQLKKKDADQADIELQQLKTETDQLRSIQYQKLAAVDSSKAVALATIYQNGVGSGLASRLDALARITASSSAIWWAHLFLVVLFMVVETAPILVKLLSGAGGYDYVVNADEYKKRTDYYDKLAVLREQSSKKIKNLSEPEIKNLDKKLSLEFM